MQRADSLRAAFFQRFVAFALLPVSFKASMLRSANDLMDFSIGATDGDIGQVEGFCFDEEQWTVRYMIVNTGGWLRARKVLISPLSIERVDAKSRTIETALTRQEVKDSPRLDTPRRISRRCETAFNDHHRLPCYWAGPKPWGPVNTPGEFKTHGRGEAPSCAPKDRRSTKNHLRTTQRLRGYRIAASDGTVGHPDDFIVDDESWTIRYLVVDTGNWWPGKKVMLSPRWIKRIN